MSAKPSISQVGVSGNYHQIVGRRVLQAGAVSRSLSVQVLQEFFVTVTRKIANPLNAETAKGIVADYSRWYLHVPAADDVLAAIGIHQRTGISFWDAMIVRSAAEIGCEVLYSEDLDAGQEYSGVRVENPFQPRDAGHG